jgi:hypothetical protein
MRYNLSMETIDLLWCKSQNTAHTKRVSLKGASPVEKPCFPATACISRLR